MRDELQLGKYEFYPNEDEADVKDLLELEIKDLDDKTIEELLNDLEN